MPLQVQQSVTCAAPAIPAWGLPTLDLTAMPTSDSLRTSDDFQTRPVACGNRKATPPSQGLQAPGSAVSALPERISYSELTRERQGGQQSTQPAGARERQLLAWGIPAARRSFDRAVRNVSSFTSRLRETICEGAQPKEGTRRAKHHSDCVLLSHRTRLRSGTRTSREAQTSGADSLTARVSKKEKTTPNRGLSYLISGT